MTSLWRRSSIRLSAAILILVLILAYSWRASLTDMYENIAYAIDPTAARAFAYGERHFSADDPTDYDIGRAEYFFELVAAKDPSTPYLYHELARISFLHGNFPLALSQINFQIDMYGDSEPNSYYVRGLIEGYMGDYTDAVNDYAHFLKFDPHDWAAINDYSWVLLKAGRPHDALVATTNGLTYSPNNPWLLNTNATALYELGLYGQAAAQAKAALVASQGISQQEWLDAYPGNDPRVAAQGIATLRESITENIQAAESAASSSASQASSSQKGI